MNPQKTMITRPSDPYDPSWPEYWAQNPGIHKGVGADGSGDGGGDGGDGGGDKGGQKSAREIELENQLAAMTGERDKLANNNKELLDEKAKTKQARQKAEEDAARASGDLKALDESWQSKLKTQKETDGARISTLEGMVRQLTAGSRAETLAAELAVDAESIPALIPHIAGRLSVDMTGDTPLVRVLDKEGKPSAMSVGDLKSELAADKALARLVKGSNASGDGGASKSGAGGSQKTAKRSEFDGWDQPTRQKFFKDGGKLVDG